MPSTSAKQHRAMEAAAHGNSTIGIPKKVGKEYAAADAAKGPGANKPKYQHSLGQAEHAKQLVKALKR